MQPYCDYRSQVWGGLGSTLIDKLQRVQTRAARIITKCGYDVRSCVLLQHLNLDNLETRRDQQLAALMFKVRNSIVPRSISNLFQRTDDVHNYETRQVQNYFPPKPNTNFKKKQFSYRGAALRWLGTVYLVILKYLKPSNVSKISFNCNESNNNFYMYGLLEDHSFCFLSVYI